MVNLIAILDACVMRKRKSWPIGSIEKKDMNTTIRSISFDSLNIKVSHYSCMQVIFIRDKNCM